MARYACLLAWLSVACTSAWNQNGPPPYTAAETNRSLAPVARLKQTCYDQSQSRRDKRTVELEFVLYTDRAGAVHSEPFAADVRDPALIDCLRRGLDRLQFPRGRAPDQLHVHFEIGP